MLASTSLNNLGQERKIRTIFLNLNKKLGKKIAFKTALEYNSSKFKLCASKNIIKKIKRQPIEWENILQTIYLIRDIAKYIKNSYNLIIKGHIT